MVEPIPRIVAFDDLKTGEFFLFQKNIGGGNQSASDKKTIAAMKVSDGADNARLIVLSEGSRPDGRSPLWQPGNVHNLPLIALEYVGVELLSLPSAFVPADENAELAIILEKARTLIVATDQDSYRVFDLESGLLSTPDFNAIRIVFGRWKLVVDRPGIARDVICEVVAAT
jgi:hypothetical protein